MAGCSRCPEGHPDYRALAQIIDQAATATVRDTDGRAVFYSADGTPLTPPLCPWGAHVVLAHGGDEEFAAIAWTNGYDR